MNSHTTHREFASHVQNRLLSQSFTCGFIALQGAVFAILGIGFWIILFATVYGFMKLALVFSPLYRGLLIAFPHANLPTEFVQPPLWYKLYACISLVFPAFFLLVGISVLQNVGFCTQNLVCALAKLAIR